MISTYFGCMTIVLKFPLTKAASTKGLQRYKGFETTGRTGDDGIGGGRSVVGEGAEEGAGAGVAAAAAAAGARLGPR